VLHDLVTMDLSVAEKAIRTGAVYLGILVLLRLAGKRDLAQLNTFDLVVLLLLSNVVQNAVIGPDDSLLGGLLGAALLVALNSVLVRVVRRQGWAVRLFEGTPTTLVRHGELDRRAIAREGLREADVVTALLRQGASHLGEVAAAVLEPGGAILVTLEGTATDATTGDVARLEAKLDRILAVLEARPR
jgi:uncharacterized membrane protein YcaP (DUF421 family)